MRIRSLIAALAGTWLLAALPIEPVSAQLAPHDDWRTVKTRNFDVHFTPELESLARRAAAVAETAWVRLSLELDEPRGRVQLVLSDNVDFSNGLATPFPTNRVIVYARPPVDVASLRFYEDWLGLVVTHELVHIFHLDRANGLWKAGQFLFGRNPALMPNLYLPAWVKEGLAVYYETRLTTAGRLAGSQFHMYARAAAEEGRLPSPGDLSLANPSFLGGEIAYAYGALAFDHLARSYGEENIGRFVDETSRHLIPFRINSAVRHAFGVSLNQAWREWADSLRRERLAAADPLPGWSLLTTRGWYATFPRWLDSTRIVYAGNTGREVGGVYSVDTSGRVRRLGRRNALEPNVPLPDGGLLFAQPDYVDPFTVRSDLWVQRNGRERRLTRGARLSRPDARGDGTIVAVQAGPGTASLVLLPPDGSEITRITSAVPDTQWTEPRWSPDGTRIAAVRWTPGGITSIVVMDPSGGVQHVLAGDRSVNAMPAWTPDGRRIVYASDRGGVMQLWEVDVPDDSRPSGAGGADASPSPAAAGREESAAPRRLTSSATGMSSPEPAPHGRLIAAVQFRSDGWHIGTGEFAPDERSAGAALQAREQADDRMARTTRAAAAVGRAAPMLAREADRVPPSSAADSVEGEARAYSPWGQLLPRYWTPLLAQGPAGGVSLGAMSSGSDVVGRHAWSAQLAVEPSSSLVEGGAAWRYAGLGQPFLDVGGSQHWSRDRITQNGTAIGDLDERVRLGALGVSFVRPRARSYASVTLGADLESRLFVPRTSELADLLRPELRGVRNTPGVRLTTSWTNVQYPALAISPEEGISAGVTLRNRWLPDVPGGTTRSAVANLAVFRSLPLPGPSHHVLAVRGAAGWQDARSTSPFEIGGVSGGSIELLPGLPVGGARRTFFVRGWEPASLEGTRAASGSVEWRAPLTVIGRGVGHLPAFLQRVSFTAFADAAAAWCGSGDLEKPVCRQAPAEREWLAGAGGEFVIDIAPVYDVLYRVRLGGAVPVAGSVPGARAPGVYVVLGSSF